MWTGRRVFVACAAIAGLVFAYCALLQRLRECPGDECRVKQPSFMIFLGGRLVYPVERVERTLSNVYLSIKTTSKNDVARLQVLFLTWFQTVPGKNLHIVSDNSSEVLDTIASYGFQLHLSPCSSGHARTALSCKTGLEFDLYYEEQEERNDFEWFCHFDDDVYVNALALSKLLKEYSPQDSIYLGRYSSSTKEGIPVNKKSLPFFPDLKRDSYYFATGAAYCLSASLMKELEFFLRGMEKFVKMSEVLGVPDDMVLGFVVESVLGYDLISKDINIRTHLQQLGSITIEHLKQQVTISYGKWWSKGAVVKNVINIPLGEFSDDQDPTRFYSYHCLLYPDISWCKSSLPQQRNTD